ncbi:cysteine synthase family protein [Salegentibacter mishustinae]|jgi:cystathionine beta-synthase|uniref:Cystathionine beta-synthase n=1 Tax=Salegentibacter mishustinae TaxID=270918 RepID=A0A0Q9Z8P5_9FLAO|nr:cysteine synthase family protein [Salegentibacter mishustinae]KRG29327.1 cystathionine beta-synthase [Salegentibacter mishustinae]PNW21625.1 cystathionine beta-synthase [Salegentibacter mishustinae]PZX64958.1 cystathionine beta-synthase [Salegentibacter mishustinae]UBZ06671.1 cysteine synthase family protein [Salegentibacter mishustinae]GGW88212.1 cystathionine beta-synthase [Salegentibacter mishustinae]|tara:strand:- start:1077 stop:2117 length:1041 start_codon:yes stop_codon:yes gene_type:complete
MKEDLQVYDNVLQLIGNTPLIKLNKITQKFKGEFFAKVEAFNPGHSAKDRIALYIIEEAERKGILKPGSTIIETTSGNTGFSIAMVSVIKGYECILAVSSKASRDKIDMLRTMGAKVYVCPAHVSADDPRSYYQVAKRLHSETKGSVYINQYFNDLNIDAHFNSTGPEIWNQTEGKITHLIACSGTGGTISGTARYLKEQNPEMKVIGIDAYGSVLKKYHETKEFDANEIYPYRIEGLGKNLIPSATDFEIIDRFVKVSDEDSAHTARELAKTEGLFVGYTSGAATQGLKQLAEEGEFDENSHVVVIYPDHGSRYMGKVFSDDWMEEQGFFDTKNEIEAQPIEFIK